MASLFLNPPPSSFSLSSLKKNPTSTITFSRYPLEKNLNFSFLRSPKANSQKLLKFSANNNEEATEKTESSSKVPPLKEDKESKVINETNKLGKKLDKWDNILREWEKSMDNFFEDTFIELGMGGWEESIEDFLLEMDESIEDFLQEMDESMGNFFEVLTKPMKEDKESDIEEWIESIEKKLKKSLREELAENAIRNDRVLNRILQGGEELRIDYSKSESLDEVERLLNELRKKIDQTCGLRDVEKLKSCFGYDTFFARDVRRDDYGWKFIGRLRKPIEVVRPILEKKIFEAIGKDVVLFFMEDDTNGITEQVCLVELKSRMDLQLEKRTLSTPWCDTLALVLCIASFGTIGLMSGSFLMLGDSFGNYLAKVLPLFGGLFSILGVSEIATRITAARYGVKLSPSFLIPSYWTGFFGVINNYESLLPNKKALFDIPVARTASAYLMSVVLLIITFFAKGNFYGGDNPLYISPEFFTNNPSFSLIQSEIGPYVDDLWFALPYMVKEMGIPVDPLAFAGLLGIAVTSLNLLPFESLEGGRIAQALFGRDTAIFLSQFASLTLIFGSLTGNVLCLAWFFIVSFFRYGEEMPAKDEITPLGDERYNLGFILSVICFFTFFPNCAGTFSISLPSLPFFGDP